MRISSQSRHGAVIVENAVVLPVFLFLVIAMIVGTLGVFRYQQVASLAREATRYASVRGLQYAVTTGKDAATPKDVYDNAILPRVTGMDLNRLTYDVSWSPDNNQGSLVTVRVTYSWIPEAFLGGMDLTSTSTLAVAY